MQVEFVRDFDQVHQKGKVVTVGEDPLVDQGTLPTLMERGFLRVVEEAPEHKKYERATNKTAENRRKRGRPRAVK